MILKINTNENEKNRSLKTDNTNSGGNLPDLHVGDLIDTRIELYEDATLANITSGSTFTLSIGSDAVPSGEFKLTYSGSSTDFVNVGTTITSIETQLNALTSVSASGGVSVTGAPSLFEIKFRDTATTKSLFTIAGQDVTNGDCSVASTDGTNNTQIVYIDASMVDYVTDFGAVESASVIIAMTGSINLNTVAAALSLGDASEAEKVFQIVETNTLAPNNYTRTLLRTNVVLHSNIVPYSFGGVDYTLPAYYNYGDYAAGVLANSLDNTIFVAKNGTDTRTDLDPHDINNPFLTCQAALTAASSGDLIMVFPGDYSGESNLAGADNVNWEFKRGSVSPPFNVIGAYTFTIDGLTSQIQLGSSCNVTLRNSIASSTSAIGTVVMAAASSASLYMYDSAITNTNSDSHVVLVSGGWAGTFYAKNCDIINTTVTANDATTGFLLGEGVSGSVQLKDCTIVTAESGSGVAESISCIESQSVYIQGNLSQTHQTGSLITTVGGAVYTNSNFIA